MRVPERKEHISSEYGTKLESIIRNDLDETHYHWFLEGEYEQDIAKEAAEKAFGMTNNVDIVKEEMFDSITILYPGEDPIDLEERHNGLLDNLSEKIEEE